MPSYLQDARRVFVANVVSAAAGLATQALLAWTLLPEGFGQYAPCILFATLLTLALALGQEMANVYYVGAGGLSASQAMTQSLAIGIAVSLVACLLGWGVTLTSLPFLNKAPLSCFRLALMCIPATVMHLYLSRILLGLGSFRAFTAISAIPATLEALALTVGCLAQLRVNTAIVIHAAADAMGAIVALGVLYRSNGCRLVPLEFRLVARSLAYGARFHLGKLFSTANVQFGTIVLSVSAVASQEIGYYAAAAAMASRLWMVSESLQVALLPRAASDPAGQSRLFAQTVRLCAACSALITLVVFFVSRPLIAIILSPNFLPVLVPFQILLIGVWIRVFPKILAAYFNGTGRPGINSLTIAVSVTSNMVLMTYLLPRWGLSGVAVSMTIAYALEAVILTVCFRNLSGISLTDLIWLNRADGEALFRLWNRFKQSIRASREGAN